MFDSPLDVKNPAILRDQACSAIMKLRRQNPVNFPYMTRQWYDKLNQALNATETLEVLSRAPVDPYDQEMREGLGILQMIVMKKAPGLLKGTWSPLLQKIASCEDASYAIADFLLRPLSKRDYLNEVRGLLATNLAHITPSTLWFLEQTQFKEIKSQQLNRLKATFCIDDCFDDEPGSLINLASKLKSPPELIDAFLAAIIRTKTPLSFKDVMIKYHDSLEKIKHPS